MAPLRFVTGIGASAGGLEALEGFLRACPVDSGIAFIVVQHLSPDHKSHMVELLSKHTTMRVVAAEDGMPLSPDTVYLIPPKKVLTVKDAALRLRERGAGLTLPVDILFRSLADEFGDRAAGVVLSGTGSDGMRGLRALKEAGGLVVVQEPSNAKFDGMPRAALSAGIADYVLPVTEMPERLALYVHHAETAKVLPAAPIEPSISAFEQILGLLRRQTGVDFAQYKPTTISRRIQRRMAITQIQTLEDYLALAQGSPREVATLFKELLISVTKFFRDPEAFEVLRKEVIPSIVDRTSPGETIRVWVAGCATGEEAYSVAMLFDEYFESGGRPREVKIFATDIDRDALDFASAGVYPESIAADVSAERVARFFVRQGDSYQVARFLRQRIVFANHDLSKDPPFSRASLITCRNLLIYFSPQLQTQVLASFRFALRSGGFLFLGASETAGDLGDELQVLNTSAKIFRRTDARIRAPEQRYGGEPKGSGNLGPYAGSGVSAPNPRPPGLQLALDALLQAYVPPTAVVNEQHEILHLFGEPSPLLRLSPGPPTLNLLQLLPQRIASVVNLATHRALRDAQEAQYHGVPTDHGDLSITVRPIPNRVGPSLLLVTLQLGPATPGLPVTSSQVTADAQRQIADLEREIQHSRENLQATIEELETSNEELQATNEELVASNEELQSTNEELQSVNEELHTLNNEYQLKISELVLLNDDVNNLLLSTRLGLIFLDVELRITRFTPAVTQVINILDRDVGRPISHLSANFLAGDFFEKVAQVRATGEPFEREYTMNGGKLFQVRIAPYLTEVPSRGGLVVTVLDVSAMRQAEQQTARVLNALPQQVALLDRNGKITRVNAAWEAFARDNGAVDLRSVGVGANYLSVCEAAAATDPSARLIAAQIGDLLAGRATEVQREYPCHSPTEERWFLMQANSLEGDEGDIVVSHTNITARKKLEMKLERSLEALRVGGAARSEEEARHGK